MMVGFAEFSRELEAFSATIGEHITSDMADAFIERLEQYGQTCNEEEYHGVLLAMRDQLVSGEFWDNIWGEDESDIEDYSDFEDGYTPETEDIFEPNRNAPEPRLLDPAEARAEAKERSARLFYYWKALNTIVVRHEGAFARGG
jgi:hypothetical protein